MKVYQITEANPVQLDLPLPGGSGKAPQVVSKKVGDLFKIFHPDGTVIGTVNNRAEAAFVKTKLNYAVNKHGIDSKQFNSAIKQLSGFGSPIGMKTGEPKPKGKISKVLDKVPGGSKVANIGSKIIAVAARTIVGKIVFTILAVDDILDDADGWAKAYMANGCKVNKQTDAYEVKIRKTITENILFYATGVTAAATGAIRGLAMLLALLPIAGWIATALAWVGSAMLASIVAKLLSKTSVAEWIADKFIGTMFGPETLKMISFPECPNESLQEDWERGILEDIAQLQEKRTATSNALAKKAAAEIKDTFLSDPELMKVLKATKKKVDAGEIEKLPKGGKQAAQAIKAKAS